MALSQLSPRRPYLLRAFYDWLLDNQLTPHLVVDVSLPGVMVPMEFARDGQIVLNIAQRAVGGLELADDSVRFNARFGAYRVRFMSRWPLCWLFTPVKTALAPCLSLSPPMSWITLRMRRVRH